MKISYKGDYALKAVFALAREYIENPGSVVSIQALAKIGDMPTKFLEQILLMLRKGGFVKSRRGAGGGFFLARPPSDITVGEVVRFVEGPIGPISCVEEKAYKGCKDIKICIFRDLWRDVRHSISSLIDNLTFTELVLRQDKKMLTENTPGDYVI